MYRELRAELKIENKLSVAPVTLFEQLIADQTKRIREFGKFVQFAQDKQTYNQLDTIIQDVVTANGENGYLISLSDGPVRHTHQMSLG